MKEIWVSAKGKSWWDKELTAHLKETRTARRGGKKRKQNRQKRFRKWRAASMKLKHMIGEKKQKCWQKFCEEQGHRNSWEIVRWLKDPWRLKTRMRGLKTNEGKEILSEQEKVEGLVNDLFGWDPTRESITRQGDEEQRELGEKEREEKLKQVGRALSRTSNSSAPGPYGINYKLIKAIRDTLLGREVQEEVATNLMTGGIPSRWKKMIIVLIPKQARDLTKTKS